ncbi:MAG: hypothetical protein AB7V27_03040 [Candidatus Binatia bacterium]
MVLRCFHWTRPNTQHDRRVTRYLREVLYAGLAAIIAVAIFRAGTTPPQYNDSESGQTIEEASAVVDGVHRWGLLEYTHHPIGRAYLLTPLVYGASEEEDLIALPAAIAALSAGLVAWILLRQAASWHLRIAILIFFAALLQQPGYANWLGNLHQHSYNLSSIFWLVFVGGVIRSAGVAFAVSGFVCGWIGYDVFFVQLMTALGVRLAYWAPDSPAPVRAFATAVSEAAAFAAGFLCAVLLHYVQNVLYFSSASMAYHDLFGAFAFRTRLEMWQRQQLLGPLLREYWSHFISPERAWIEPLSLAFAIGALAMAVLADATARPRAAGVSFGTLALGGLALACAPAAILVWFFAAPNHVAPHLELFPRWLLVPLIAAAAIGSSLVRNTPAPPPPSWLRTPWSVAAVAVLVIGLTWGPRTTVKPIDGRWFGGAWNSPSAAPRTESMSGHFLAATAEASSTNEYASVNGPVQLKPDVPMVGDINVWATQLDTRAGLRWWPDAPAPSWYAVHFSTPAAVTDVALRFWGAQKREAGEPARFTLAALFADGTSAPVRTYPSRSASPVRHGKYLTFHYRFSPPLDCIGLRLDIAETVTSKAPVMTDFLAFGYPIEPTAPESCSSLPPTPESAVTAVAR